MNAWCLLKRDESNKDSGDSGVYVFETCPRITGGKQVVARTEGRSMDTIIISSRIYIDATPSIQVGLTRVVRYEDLQITKFSPLFQHRVRLEGDSYPTFCLGPCHECATFSLTNKNLFDDHPLSSASYPQNGTIKLTCAP